VPPHIARFADQMEARARAIDQMACAYLDLSSEGRMPDHSSAGADVTPERFAVAGQC
jgi:hypothetical protein